MRPTEEWQEVLAGAIQEAIPSSRILESSGPQIEVNLLLVVGERRLMVDLKLARGPRISEVEGQLARAVLQLGKRASEKQDLPVAVVALPGFGRKLESAAASFMEDFAPGVGWGLLDESGQAVLVIPELGVRWRREASQPEWGRRIPDRGDRQLFTDLNRWMLKVLLLRFAPEESWGGPRKKPRHPTELAEVAGVSVAKAHNFTSLFEARGLLRKSRQGLKLVRVQEILQSWLQAEKNAPLKAVPARALLPSVLPDETHSAQQRLPVSAWDSAVVGGASAALQQGLLRMPAQQPLLIHLMVPISRAFPEWEFEECELRDAEMMLSKPLFPQSVFRGRVCGQEGPPMVDMWQIALDSISSSNRGREQAEYILERVLALQVSE